MASSTQSFDDLLSSRLLDVPDYQRGYAWEAVHLELQLGADVRSYWYQDILEGTPSVYGPRLAAEYRLRRAAAF